MATKKENKRKKVKLYLTAVTSCIVLAGVLAVLVTPETSLAKGKPGGGGGGEVGQIIPVCITFDDAAGFGVKNDGDVYCDGDLKNKVTAVVGRNFNIVFEPNNSNKRTAGRTLFLDLSAFQTCGNSVNVDVSDGEGGGSDGICDECFDSVPDLPIARFGTPPLGQKAGYPDNAKLEILGRDLDGLLVGNTVKTNGRLKFSVGDQDWVLHYGPHEVPGGATPAPGTEPVTVERLDNDTWRIVSVTGDACLYRRDNPPHAAAEYHGQVLVPFGFTAVAIEHEETVWGDEPNGIVLGDDPCVPVL
ncbi:MAG: hypothetical protein ISS70_01365 [Phycisphaerae bacterium]|nr:hypothetical protein [Phycisphaerae bacterium]